MKRLIILSTLLVVTNAHAVMTYVNPLGEWSSSASLSLQGVIDARGNTLVSIANASHQSNDSMWMATGSMSAGMVVELAGFAPNNSFGLYNVLNPLERVQIFGGSAVGGDVTGTIASPAFSAFGFYLENDVQGFTWYSDSSLNPGGTDQMVAYAGQGETLGLGSNPGAPVNSFVWDENTLLLGWEDVSLPDSDADYQDMVVLIKNVRSISSVEEALSTAESVPDVASTASLLALSFFGLMFARGRKRN